LTYGTESHAEALSYFPEMEDYNVGPEKYLELIRQAKKTVKVPVIGSLNGVSAGGWTRYAKLIQDAGADAIELNVYYIPTNPDLSGAEVEKMYIDVLQSVKKSVKVPVAIKISPYFSSTANIVKRLADAGADGVVMFNRFYQPEIDLENLEVVPNLALSTSGALRTPLRWVAILHGRVKTDFAITSGVHNHEDVLKAVMAGASAVQMASELLVNGTRRMNEILDEMVKWMEKFEYESLNQMKGSMSQKNVAQPAAFERANYMKALQSFTRV